jgi:hypothetical protein
MKLRLCWEAIDIAADKGMQQIASKKIAVILITIVT